MTDIHTEKLWKSYGSHTVLAGLDARFPAGTVTGVMGPSGCGKTTLLRLLAGLEKPDGGHIRGVPERIAAVFQENRLCEGLSAAANIRLVTGHSRSREEIDDLLSQLGLPAGNAPVRSYSGGMQRRVAMARALLYRGDLLLLDEPFQGLDAPLRAHSAQLMRRYSEGATLIVVTHDPAELELLGCQEVLELGKAQTGKEEPGCSNA